MERTSVNLESLKDIPGYKVILKTVLHSQIQQLVEQLSQHTEEEVVFLTASLGDGTLSHLGSGVGKEFLQENDDIKSHFLAFCLKRQHQMLTSQKSKQAQSQIKGPVPVKLTGNSAAIRHAPYSTSTSGWRSRRKTLKKTRYDRSANQTERSESDLKILESVSIQLAEVDENDDDNIEDFNLIDSERISDTDIKKVQETEEVTSREIQEGFRSPGSANVSNLHPNDVPRGTNAPNSVEENSGINVFVHDPSVKVKVESVDVSDSELNSGNLKSEVDQSSHRFSGATGTSSDLQGNAGGETNQAGRLKRSKMATIYLSQEDQEDIIDWFKANPFLYDRSHADFKLVQRKNAMWDEKAKNVAEGQYSDADVRTHICRYCGKCFTSTTGLKQHEARHRNQGLYKCTVCDVVSFSKFHADDHRMRHENERNHICNKCSKSFKTFRDLKRHQKREENEGMFRCDTCQKTFKVQSDLVDHSGIHTGEKNHVCGTCGKHFRFKPNLTRHKAIHQKAGHHCEICSKTFNSIRTLKIHKSKTH